MATPMLAEMLASSLASRKGSANRRRIRSATASASVLRPSPSHSTANSSPPMRATVSPGRTLADSRTATAASSSSPARWPRLSLRSLKPSRSTKIRVTGSSGRSWRALSSLRVNTARPGRPVSGSRRNCCSLDLQLTMLTSPAAARAHDEQRVRARDPLHRHVQRDEHEREAEGQPVLVQGQDPDHDEEREQRPALAIQAVGEQRGGGDQPGRAGKRAHLAPGSRPSGQQRAGGHGRGGGQGDRNVVAAGQRRGWPGRRRPDR